MTNSKRVFKRVLASLLVAVMVVGIAPMTGFVDLFGTDAQAASCVYEYPIRTVCNTGDGYKSNHSGVDFTIGKGTNVYAVTDGTVTKVVSGCTNWNGASKGSGHKDCKANGCSSSKTYMSGGGGRYRAGYYCNGGSGNGITIKCADGKTVSYGHLQSIKVKKGEHVNARTVIGTVGSTGCSTGPHLHFSITDSKGKSMNPFSVLKPFYKIYVENNTGTNPKICVSFPWRDFAFSECKIKFGTSASNLSKTASDKNGACPSCYWNAGQKFGNAGKLEKNKTYYFQWQLTKDGATFSSAVYSFVVGKGNITFLDHSKITDVVPKPPAISANVGTNVAVGTLLTISWAGDSNAAKYLVYVNGKLVQDNSNTSYLFSPNKAGSYSVYVVARNSSNKDSSASKTITITAHNPATVTFIGLNGKVLGTQEVKYGGNAVTPDVPTEEGYTFLGWDKSRDAITQDLTITAQYKINTYSVKFLDAKGNRIGSEQTIEYASSAVAPVAGTDFNAPTGYEFLGWDSEEYLSVKQDLTIRGIYAWGNTQLPIVASITSATRQDDGYYVYFDLTNCPDAITRGRAVVSLKTAEGKLVDTTESAAFSIPKDTTKTGMEVFIPCESAATSVELVIVDGYKSGVPISANVTTAIDQGLEWTDWSEELPEVDESIEIEQRTEYRTSMKETITETNTQSDYAKEGWELGGKTSAWGEYGAWSSWSKNAATASDSRKVETRTVTDKAAYTQYRYSHYRSGTSTSPVYYSGWSDQHYTPWMNSPLTAKGTSNAGGTKYASYKCPTCGLTSYWYNQETKPVAAVTHKEYRYADRVMNYTHNFYRWTDWSDWTTTETTATDTVLVDTRTVYRYRSTNVGVEDASGQVRTVSGTLDPVFAGKQATLYVYKIDEASDWTNEYVGQSVIGADGSYSFTFKLREEPTAKTGDFTVALGIEGSSGMVVLDTIPAPVPQFVVNFYDFNGNIVKTETVDEFGTATAPENPTREGYDFLGWDNSLTNVKCNLDVMPRFVKRTYTVVFVNWTTQTVTTKTFEHGDFLTGPEVEPIEGTTFTGWSGIVDGTTVATQNMIVTAEYTKDNCEVVFYDFDGNVISTQNVDYGDDVEVPDDLLKENYVFLGWSTSDGELNFDAVDGSKAIYPVYAYEETVAAPIASVTTGIYTEAQTVTLSCETENAVIYYSTDGSDPLEGERIYTSPLTISRSTELKFAACAFEMNDSDTVTELYAINTDDMTSEWMAYADIPQFVMEDLATYTLESQNGYRYKDVIETSTVSQIESLLADGWTDEGTTHSAPSEWSLTSPELEDTDYVVNEREPDPVPVTHYQYSHFKYYDEASESYKYSNAAVDGVTGETEEIVLETPLSVVGFMQGTTTPYYSYNGEQWFTQTPVTVYVPAGYLMYNYETVIHTMTKWTDWSVETPDAAETRETQSDTVFRYTIPEYKIVTIASILQDEDTAIFAVANETLDIDVTDYEIDGYTFDGFYTDAEFITKWNLDTDKVTQSMTLYPKYTVKSFTVTFKNSDGTTLDTQQVEYLYEATAPEVPVAEGYVHVGWDTDDYLCVCNDLTVTARVVLEEDVTKVSLSRGKYSMMEGSYYKLIATVAPSTLEDRNVVWSSSDYGIIDVDENGNVYAVSEGTATVTAVAFDGTTAECVFTVIGNPDNFVTLKPMSGYGIDDAGFVRGIIITTDEAEGTHLAQTVAEVKARFINDDLVFFDINNNVLSDTDLVGTGTKAAIMNGSIIADSVTFVITGDTNGDGRINNRDAAVATRFLVDKEAPNAAQMVALDVNGDGFVNNRDASMLSRYLVGKEAI